MSKSDQPRRLRRHVTVAADEQERAALEQAAAGKKRRGYDVRVFRTVDDVAAMAALPIDGSELTKAAEQHERADYARTMLELGRKRAAGEL